MRTAAIVLVLVGLFVLWILAILGRLVAMRGRVLRDWGVLDRVIRRRHELLPELVLAIKALEEIDPEPVTRVIDARNAAIMAGGVQQRAAAEVRLSLAMRIFFDAITQSVLVQANAHVQQLEGELLTIEHALVSAGLRYNESVAAVNRAYESVPANVLAGAFRFEPATLFAPSDDAAT